MEIDPKASPNASGTEGSADGPQPPRQLYPPPESADPGATSTNVRMLREDVLEELQEDNQFMLPLRTRLALVGLLAASLCVVIILVPRGSQQPSIVAPDQVSRPDPAPDSARPIQTQTPIEKPPILTQTPVKPPVEPARPAKPFSRELADVEMLAALIREDMSLEPSHAVELLTPYLKSDDAGVKKAAQAALAPMYARLDEQARSLARAGAESAEDNLSLQNFPAALDILKLAADTLPPGAPWSERGKKELAALIQKTTQQRDDARKTVFDGLEEALRAEPSGVNGGDEGSRRLAALLVHPDATFRVPAEALKAKLGDERSRQLAEKQQRDSAARKGWTEFFVKFDAAMAKGDYASATALCNRPANDAILAGGVRDPAAVLNGCATEIKNIEALYDAALARAKDFTGDVSLETRRHSRLEGKLNGVEGRRINVRIAAGGDGGARIDDLSSSGLTSLIGSEELTKQNLRPSLWALTAYENPQTAAVELPRLYANAKLPLPVHWAERFRLVQMQKAADTLEKKIAELQQTIGGPSEDATKFAAEAARTAVADYEKFEPVTAAQRTLVESATKLSAATTKQEVILQNDLQPTPDYAGILIDQITDYRESLDQNNIAVQFGLKVGSAGPLQRLLIRFDGVEAAIGKAKLKKATLQLYQKESPNYANAAIALIRLKRPWVPGAGTWLSYDKTKKMLWSVRGGLGDADIEPKEEGRVIIDKNRDVWRAWDVTQYVKDVLTGKQQNFGFLMRVMNNELDYHVRFYPPGDLEGAKDKSLRPRVVLEIEK